MPSHFFICSIILASAFVVLAKDESPCGVFGVPKDGKSTKDNHTKEHSITYSCNKNTILIGDRQRKCVNEKFTGSTPICMPFVNSQRKNSDEYIHFDGSGLELLNSNSFKCSNEAFGITFERMMITDLFVWTNSTCTKLNLYADSDIIKETSPVKSEASTTYFFTVNKRVTAINISQSDCCLYRVIIADPSVSVRCGSPDIPPGVEYDKTANKVTFRCSNKNKLEGPESSTCIGMEKWSQQSDSLKCVSDHSSIWIIVLASIFVIAMTIAAFYLGVWYISKSEVAFDTKTLTRQLMDRYKGTKVEYKEVTLLKPRDKDGFCRNYFAQFQKKEALAHVCDLSSASAKSIPPVEQMRCLYSAVHFDFKHENVQSVIALSLDPKKNPILVFDSSSKATLHEYVKVNKNLTQKDLLALSLNVCNGMIFLSQRGIVHRNLKAKNCIVDDFKKVKISNFKMAQELGNFDQFQCKAPVSREQMPWAAPETIAGNVSSVESDIWSYGVVLWEIFSGGKEPYEGLTDVQITTFLLDEERLPQPKDCPDGIYALMLDCWKTDSDQRSSFAVLGINIQSLAI